jgi:hypothetical protein
VNYNAETSKQALGLAEAMNSNLGGTQIYEPLALIFSQSLKGIGIRQLFVLTDGELRIRMQCSSSPGKMQCQIAALRLE